jgi:very-short-patch-repair endonuclease
VETFHKLKVLFGMEPGKINNFGYNRHLQPFANDLRKDMTKAEACLWKYALKAGKMKDYQFRRQRPVLNYIVDFICLPLKLIIEADGFTHQSADQTAKDEKRDKDLTENGFRVLRFADSEILKDMANVIRTIETVIEDIASSLIEPASTPYPSRKIGTGSQRGTAPGNNASRKISTSLEDR